MDEEEGNSKGATGMIHSPPLQITIPGNRPMQIFDWCPSFADRFISIAIFTTLVPIDESDEDSLGDWYLFHRVVKQTLIAIITRIKWDKTHSVQAVTETVWLFTQQTKYHSTSTYYTQLAGQRECSWLHCLPLGRPNPRSIWDPQLQTTNWQLLWTNANSTGEPYGTISMVQLNPNQNRITRLYLLLCRVWKFKRCTNWIMPSDT